MKRKFRRKYAVIEAHQNPDGTWLVWNEKGNQEIWGPLEFDNAFEEVSQNYRVAPLAIDPNQDNESKA